MQEGPLALLQTAKIALARQRMAEAGMPFICVVTNPTLGAAYAGIAGHADFAIGEPGALVGYAAERSRATETEQTTEELLRHGLLDAVVDRERLRDLISQSLDVLTARTRVAAEGAPPPPPEHAHGTAWNAVQIARHAERPAALDYIGRMATTFVELRGDRSGLDDSAVTCGIAIVAGEAVVILAQRTTGGWIGAAGFRKAGRAVALATRFRLPIISLIDTAGADPSAAAGLGGLGPAMADLMGALAQAPVPVIAAVIGQGGSEAAAAFGIADRVLMLEHAIYTVIAPEQAAVLLHHDATRAAEVADALHLTADACHELKVVDTIVPEPAGGAHTDHDGAARNLRAAILRALAETQSVPPKRLLRTRYRRYRAIGEYHSYIGTTLTHEVSELRSAIAARAGAAASHHARAGRSSSRNRRRSVPDVAGAPATSPPTLTVAGRFVNGPPGRSAPAPRPPLGFQPGAGAAQPHGSAGADPAGHSGAQPWPVRRPRTDRATGDVRPPTLAQPHGGPAYPVAIVPILTTSKSRPLTWRRVASSLSFQRGSGAPLTYQLLPLSATIMPYVFIAWRMTCTAGEKPEMLKPAFSRTRIPIGGRLASVSVLA
ncbi:MAG: carboxyl transferase domain-containing protein [Dehalococcoidia bacterium]